MCCRDEASDNAGLLFRGGDDDIVVSPDTKLN